MIRGNFCTVKNIDKDKGLMVNTNKAYDKTQKLTMNFQYIKAYQIDKHIYR